ALVERYTCRLSSAHAVTGGHRPAHAGAERRHGATANGISTTDNGKNHGGPTASGRNHLPWLDTGIAAQLGRAALRGGAASGHGSGRGNLSPLHFPEGHWPGELEQRLCATFTPPHRRPLWREPQPTAALLSVPGRAQAVARQHSGPVPEFV